MRTGLATALLAALLLAPGLAHACAVCFSASDEYREAFTFTTALLSLLPLLLIGSVIGWLIFRVRLVSRADAARAPNSALREDVRRAGRKAL